VTTGESTEKDAFTLPARWRPMVACAGVVLLFIVVVRSAWLSDDAFISFRAAQNLVHGYGLVSNPAERVQGFTNPLWTLVIAALHLLPMDIYWIGVTAGLACTVALALLLGWRSRSLWAAALAVVLLAVSTGFAAFSTGGLENPLAHLLLAAFCLERLRPGPDRTRSWVLAGLITLDRADHLLLVLPALVGDLVGTLRSPDRRLAGSWWRPVLIGTAPVAAWFLFATIYYGFPFPNTAYAKLNLGISRSELALQGVSYLLDATLRDPIVPLALLLSTLVGFAPRRPAPQVIPLLVGMILYVAYLVSVGGDFMSGRLLTAPYLVAVLALAESLANMGGAACLALITLALVHRSDLLAARSVDPKTECAPPPSGIVDERACYVERTGIAQNVRLSGYRNHDFYLAGAKLTGSTTHTVASVVGMLGVAAGPTVHVVDEDGLTDPLLARIQFRPKGPWRIGHFNRPIPAGYLETLQTGVNRIGDPCAARLWEDLRVVTRSRPLLAPHRLATILRLNLRQRVCPPPR
jgi:arabinofuranosyltransferase